MRVIARINADGSLLIRGKVFTLIPSWDEAQELDDTLTIDEATEIDDAIQIEEFWRILVGLQSQGTAVDRTTFDYKGNLLISQLITGMSGFEANSDGSVSLKDVQEESGL